jgi:Rps23 Pro-64 3,4-dihydroxylase Tpa1-like proline 4-hydroxylase
MSGTRQVNTPSAREADDPIIIVDDFLPEPLAMAMRRDIDAHFAHPEAHRGETHQVWNYWFIPELYAYLRTDAGRVIQGSHVAAFHAALRDWAMRTLGMAEVTWPYLSLYIPGCRQGWHNDAKNGRFGFVYSLTKNARQTIGGETLVLHENDPFRTNLTTANAGRGFYEPVEPRFNRLVIFDDRLPHAVERVDGSMDPVEGRFVLHGHLSEGTAFVVGPLPAAAVGALVNETLQQFAAECSAAAALYHGPLSLRLTIAASGAVAACDILTDRVLHPDPGHVDWGAVRSILMARLKALKFPATDGRTVLIQSVLFGSPMH